MVVEYLNQFVSAIDVRGLGAAGVKEVKSVTDQTQVSLLKDTLAKAFECGVFNSPSF